MTEEIIIDGIDVSGCELYRDDNGVFAPDGTAERTELCYLTNDYCGNNTNCYYKQLKRKKQECEFSNLRIIQLQETLSQYETDLSTKDCIVETLKAQYNQLKAENEKLKEQLTILDDEAVVVEITVEQFEEYKKLKAENEHLAEKEKEAKHYLEEAKKFKNCLIEIKKIAKKETQPYCETWKVDGYSKILQKISEVEDERI